MESQVSKPELDTGPPDRSSDQIASTTSGAFIDDKSPNDLEAGLDDKKKRLREGGFTLVDWDGDDDPENPRNWPRRDKWGAMLIIGAYVFVSPVSSSMMAPAASIIAKDFNITNTTVEAMLTSIFVLGYAFGPLFFSPMSEVYGRSKVVQYGNIIYLACGGAQNAGQLLAFRFLAGIGGSAPLGIGAAVIADCFKREERGKAIAVYAIAPLLGPVVGPICGAWIAEKTSWRWVFWSTTIADGVIQVLGFFFLRETYTPVLLRRKADELQKAAGKDSSILYATPFDGSDRTLKRLMRLALVRPFMLFVSEPILQLLSAYLAFMFGLDYLILTTVPSIFEKTYHESVAIAGLNYVALGVGTMFGAQLGGLLLDSSFRYLKAKNNGVSAPEYRVVLTVPGTLLLPLGLLLMGWPAEKHFHWIVVDIGMTIVGFSILTTSGTVQAYVLDAFTLHAASAQAVVVFFRSLFAFGFPLFAPPMYDALGYGKGDTILAAVAIGIGFPSPWILWHYGAKIRAMSKHAS